MILSLMDKLSDGADLTICRLPIKILFVLSALSTRRFPETHTSTFRVSYLGEGGLLERGRSIYSICDY